MKHDRVRNRQTETDRQTDSQRHRETYKERETKRQKETPRECNRDRQTDRKRQTATGTEKERESKRKRKKKMPRDARKERLTMRCCTSARCERHSWWPPSTCQSPPQSGGRSLLDGCWKHHHTDWWTHTLPMHTLLMHFTIRFILKLSVFSIICPELTLWVWQAVQIHLLTCASDGVHDLHLCEPWTAKCSPATGVINNT